MYVAISHSHWSGAIGGCSVIFDLGRGSSCCSWCFLAGVRKVLFSPISIKNNGNLGQ
jgi:hypothetical protein